MSNRSAIILVIDGLGAAHLGPYGNSWVGTAGFDALAAESLVVEHAISDCPTIRSSYRSYWQGRHAMCQDGDLPSIAALCRSHGIEPRLITDVPDVANHHLAAEFASHVVPINLQAPLAAVPERTHFAHFAESVVSTLEQLQPPFCLWVHAMGLSGPWDCPYEMRKTYVDESDPQPTEETVPPQFYDVAADPDRLWRHHVAYAAQVSLIDASIAVLRDVIRDLASERELLTILTSPRGYPLGDHGHVGYAPALLNAEQLQVPLLIHGATDEEVPCRAQQIAQPPDVFGTLVDWFGLNVDRRSTGARSLLCLGEDRHWQSAASLSDGNTAFRTGGWYLVTPVDASDDSAQLYVKPDDRLEVNEVSQRLPDTVRQMSAALDEFRAAAWKERLDRLEPLDALLRQAQV
jgi:hypothetical protein